MSSIFPFPKGNVYYRGASQLGTTYASGTVSALHISGQTVF